MPILALLLAAAPIGDVSPITPSLIGRMIDKYGPEQTVHKLAMRRPQGQGLGAFDVVLNGIASGDGRWLSLVPRLDSGTDGGTAESLRIAVAEALPKNAAGVLAATASLPWFRQVCSFPMIEPTLADTLAYFRTVIPSVSAIRDTKLQKAKRICLTELAKAQPGR